MLGAGDVARILQRYTRNHDRWRDATDSLEQDLALTCRNDAASALQMGVGAMRREIEALRSALAECQGGNDG